MTEMTREEFRAMEQRLTTGIARVSEHVIEVHGEIRRVEQKLDLRDEALRHDLEITTSTADSAKKAAGAADTRGQVTAAKLGLFGAGGGGLVSGLIEILKRVTGAE